MQRVLVRKLAHLVPVLLLVTLAATALVDLLPGSPAVAILGQGATPEQVAAFDAEYGYDRPLPVRYLDWLGGAVTGDLGASAQSGRPVLDEILRRVPVTLEIAVLSLALSLTLAVPLAVFAAARAGGVADRIMTAAASLLMSVPSFVAAMLLLFVLSVQLSIFPVTGWWHLRDGVGENLYFALLPALSLTVVELPVFLRILRSDMITTLQEDFVLTARSKGLSRRYVLFRHALRPSLFSLLTVAGLTLGRLLGGSVVIEFLFALPGLGNLAVQSIHAQDIPMVQGLVVFVAVAYVLINTLVDLGYRAIDPRVEAR